MPIDRFYIETFLQEAAGDIRGHVLEIGEDLYVRRFGAGVTAVDILDVDADNPKATIVADLAQAGDVQGDRFDCIVCTQTLLLIYDVRAALATLARLLKPGGVLLATVPGISKICRPEADDWGDYWRFTTYSIQKLAAEAFPDGLVAVRSYGNVLAAIGFLHGLAVEDVGPERLAPHDPDYEVIVAFRVVKGRRGEGGVEPAADQR
ncbi:MAG: methyltransferase domain-containing protein [Acidimicrobiia bacterium]